MRKFFIMALIAVLVIIMLPAVVDSYARVVPEMPSRFSLHDVERGDTLWSISQRYLRDVDPRTGVMWIRRANGMPVDYVIQPGDLLNIPDYDGLLTEPYGQD